MYWVNSKAFMRQISLAIFDISSFAKLKSIIGLLVMLLIQSHVSSAQDNDSDIIVAPFVKQSNIDPTSNTATDIDGAADDEVEVARFTLRDGGSGTDADGASTVLTDITLIVSNPDNVNKIALYETGGAELAEGTLTAGTVTFSTLTLTAADDGTQDFSVFISFVSDGTIVDGDAISVTIDVSTLGTGAGSGLSGTFTGGVDLEDTNASDENRIEVTATALSFTVDASTTDINASMSPSPEVSIVDSDGNVDTDNSAGAGTTISITSDGTLDTSPKTASLSSGVATFSNIVHTATATLRSLTATTTGGLTDGVSSTFDINALDNDSDIVVAPFVKQTNIDPTSNTATDIDGAADDEVEVARFTLRDGGSGTDADGASTVLTDITLIVSNPDNVNKIALYETGGAELAEGTLTAGTVTFSTLTLTAADDGTQDFSVFISFVSDGTIVDGDAISVTIDVSTLGTGAGSGLSGTFTGGVDLEDTNASDENRIEVTATALSFTVDASTTDINASMSPSPEVSIVDSDGNVDTDNSAGAGTTISITSDGTLDTSPKTASLSSGVATFSNIVHTATATLRSLTATTTGGLTDGVSSTFDIVNAPPTITEAAWIGDGLGNITGIYVEFSEAVDIVDDNGPAAGFDAFSFTNGSYTFDDTDYTTAAAVTNQIFTLATPITGTAGPIDDLIYNTGSSTITSNATLLQMDNGELEIIVDGAAPIVLAAATVDNNQDGTIDGLEVQFSEPMNETALSANEPDWSLTDGTNTDQFNGFSSTVNALTSSASTTDAYVTFTISAPTVVGTGTMSYAYANGNPGTNDLDDGSTNILADIALATATDAAAPVVLSADFYDTDDSGNIDEVVITFSEDIDDTNFDVNDFSIDGSTPSLSASDDSGITDGANDEVVILDVSVTGTAVPVPATTFTNGGGNYLGLDGLAVLDNSTITENDLAAPVVLAAATVDNNQDGTIDGLEVQFSEPMNETALSANEPDWSLTDGTNTDQFNGFSSTVNALTSSASTTDAYVTFTISAPTVVGTGTMSYAYANGNPGTNDLDDGSTNILADIALATATDAAAPVVLSADFYDTDDSGNIDEVVITFSEDIDDTNFDVNDFSIDGSTPSLSASDDSGITDGANDEVVILDVSVTGTAVPVPATTFTNGGGNYLGLDGLAVLDNSTITENDLAAPVVVSATMATSNAYLEVVYSEDVRASTDPGDPILPADFNTTFTDGGSDGSITALVTADITDNADVTLIGAASTVRFVLSATGSPNSGDDAIVTPIASAVQDIAGNDLAVAEVATDAFNNVTAVTFTGFTIQSDNSYVTVTVSTPVDRQSGGGTNAIRFPQEVNFGSFTDPDGSMGAASFAVTAIRDNTGAGLGSGGYSTFRFLLDLDGGTASGDETFRIFPVDGSSVYSTASGVAMSASEFIEITLADQLAPTFVSATYYDTDEDGTMDEVLVEMSESINDATITNDNYRFNGTTGTALATGSIVNTADPKAANDKFITFSVDIGGTSTSGFTTSYAVSTDPLSLADNSSNANLALANTAITTIDAAAPVMLSAFTNDTDLDGNGRVDRIDVVFSEDVTGLDLADFVITGYTGTSIAAGVTADSVLITVTELGSFDLDAEFFNLRLQANAIQDGDGNDLSSPQDIDVLDGAKPYYVSIADNDPNGNGYYGLGDPIVLDVDMEETGLFVEAILDDLFGFPFSTSMTDDGDGTYSFTTPNADFMLEGIGRAIDFDASDLNGNERGNSTLTVNIDITNPELSSASIKTANTEITLVFDEDVSASSVTPGDFKVTDGLGTGFTVTAAVDGTNTDEIDLTVNDFTTAVGDLTITYVNTSGGIIDIAANALLDDTEGIFLEFDGDAPIISSASLFSNTRIDVSFSEEVKIVNPSPSADFTVTDGIGNTYAVSALSDGTPQDNIIRLTVQSLANAVGDITVTYDNSGGSVIEDFGGNSLATDATGVDIDIDTDAPAIVSAATVGSTQINLTFDDAVQVIDNTNIIDEFTVADEQGNNWNVSAVNDATPNDEILELTIADFSASVGDLIVSYAKSNSIISDFGGNDLASEPGVRIERNFVLRPDTVEVKTNTVIEDVAGNVAMLRVPGNLDPDGFNILTITPKIDGNTITIYRNEAQTDIVGSAFTNVVGATNFTVADFMAEDITNWNGTDDNGIFTFYITETAVGGVSSEGPAIKYSLAFLDEIDNQDPEDDIAFSQTDNVGAVFAINHSATLDELIILGSGLTDFVYNPGSGTSEARFVPSAVAANDYQISFRWIDTESSATATFKPAETLLSVSAVAADAFSGAVTRYCKIDGAQAFTINTDPSGVDVLESTGSDDGDVDFKELRAFHVLNGVPSTDVTSTIISFTGTAATSSTPASAAGWSINPSGLTSLRAVDTVLIRQIVQPDAGGTEFIGSSTVVYFYPQPTVTITNEIASTPYICVDDDPFTVQATISPNYTGGFSRTGNITIGEGYTLRSGASISGPFSTVVPVAGTANVFDPADYAAGFYQIEYQSPADPTISPASCRTTATVAFEILAKPPTFSLTQSSYAGAGGFLSATGEYLLEYCEGTTLFNLQADNGLASGSGNLQFEWYNDINATNLVNSASITTITQTNDAIDVGDAFFGGNDAPSGQSLTDFFFRGRDYINIGSSGFAGCISDLREVNIVIYNEPNAIAILDNLDADTTNVVNLATQNVIEAGVSPNAYIYEYCVDQGTSASLESIVVNSGLSADSLDESYFTIYDASKTALTTFDVNDLTPMAFNGTLTIADIAVELGLSGLGYASGDAPATTFYISRTDFDNEPANNPNITEEFEGCESDLRKFFIDVYEVPSPPNPNSFNGDAVVNNGTQDVVTYYTCEGDGIRNLLTPQLATSKYTWYIDDGTGTPSFEFIDPSAFNDNFVTQAELIAQGRFNINGRTGPFTSGQDTTFTYWVTQTENINNLTGFFGCESNYTRVDIVVYPDPDTPEFTNANGVAIGSTTDLAVNYCEGSLDKAQFTISGDIGANGAQPVFKWYRAADATFSSYLNNDDTPIFTSLPGNGLASASDLKLLTLEAPDDGFSTYYYMVSQVNNINNSFNGCETELGTMAQLTITVYDVPDIPTMSVSRTDNNITNSTSTTFYFAFDSTKNYNSQIGNSGNFIASGVAGEEYYWYDRTGPIMGQSVGPSNADDQVLLSDIFSGLNDIPGTNPTTIRTLEFGFTQTTNKNLSFTPLPFDGCESPEHNVTIDIIPIPDTPTPTEREPGSTDVELCEDETVGALTITNRAAGAEVYWFFADPRAGSVDTLNVDNGVYDGPTYTPTDEVEGRAGTYTFYVQQVTNIGIDGSGFIGSQSAVEEVTVTVYPSAGSAESTADNNIYVYCLGDPISNLQIDNPQNGVTYSWYADINLNTPIGTSTSTNNNLSPNQNAAFDANVVGIYNYYVTTTLVGQGCESDPTLVQIDIKALPDPEIKFNTGVAFENEIDVPELYQLCVDEAPIDIIGSVSGTRVGVFTGLGVTQTNGGRAQFDPLAALGIDDPLDMPEGEIDTVYVNYNLTNAANCDVDYRVGFVITALPRPNFTVGITSPRNIPVLRENDDSGVACVDIDPNNLATVTRFTLSATGGKQTGQFFLRNDVKDTVLSIANGSIELPLGEWSDATKTQDTLFIRYVFSDNFGCSYFKDKQIILHENPIVEYEHIVGCIGEPATFTANAVAPFTNSDISSWEWSVVNNQTGLIAEANFTNGERSIETTFSDPNTYRVRVRGVDANYIPLGDATCVSIDEATINASTPNLDEERDEVGNTQLIPIGDFPIVDYSWQFITENSPTIISGKDTQLENLGLNVNGDVLNGIRLVWMDWGDGSPLDTLQANELSTGVAFGNESHTYTADGWYDAKLKISTINGCVDSTTKVIKILPHIVVNPATGISNTFEASSQEDAGWFVDESEMGSVPTKTTSWSYGTISPNIEEGTVDFGGSQGWGTDKDAQGYLADAGSWVFSPSYDISAMSKPMVLFDGYYSFAQNDGAIMEYSTDNGASWNMLGRYILGDDQGTGINWYGTLDIRSDPGKQREIKGANNASGWGFVQDPVVFNKASFRHKLDEIPIDQRDDVRFRFYFASTSANDDAGFIFDNFEIAERNRISLVEQFSNSNVNQDRGNFAGGQYTSLSLNNELNKRLDSMLLNNNDLVAVNYYTEIYGNDPLFEVSKDGPSARTLFYGLNAVTSVLDGNVQVGANLSTNANTPPWTGAESNRNTLRDSKFDVQLALNSADNDEISVTATVISGEDFANEDIRIYLAVVEKVLTGESLPNGEFEPRNVFRDFLPSPLGHVLTDLSEGGTNTFTESWKINARKVLDPDQLAIVAFVQKANGDREVYQAARVDVNGKTSILGVGDLIELDDLNLYPNPAGDQFFVTFDLTLEEDFQWRLYDQSGRLMNNGEVFKGMDGFRVESANLPSGLYLLSIGNEVKQYTNLKVIVKH